ncbi:BTB/POZ and MATH domain-containing protein 2-like [Panicum virgatum]|uniref:Uncharacterized protein n=1 Tax=Panicum virgatum TaxID=38727 RepID=A0A8T0PWY0_PANVG|nr:BTB/POZ and MATH domain-containing protein 2-like [Panicum virgatum]KAG2563456.1 hypothetical protein PVAP13_8KG353000 [Panicum virgatum]
MARLLSSPPCGEALSASTIVAEAVTGSHVLKIEGYSLTKGLGNGEFICSSTFSVGGHRWCIRYYPDGDGLDSADWISIYLQHDDTCNAVDAKAQSSFSVLDEIGEPVPKFIQNGNLKAYSAKVRCWGFDKFIERKALEESACLKDDILRVRCDVTVVKDIRTEATEQFVVVTPSNIHVQFGRLLQAGEGADVTFEVAGETFAAHRCVLAARSPVFMAELLGPMKEKATSHVRVDDMEPGVFEAMLHFIYTDTMAAGTDKGDDDAPAAAQHLLVAADRYDLERLKLMCEEKLCNYIGTSTVATTLALAEQHGCHGLKKACFDFLRTPSHLKEAMASEGFDHLLSSCPSVIKELLAKAAPCP